MDDAWEKQPSDADDAYTEHELVREEALLEQVDWVAKVDNDFCEDADTKHEPSSPIHVRVRHPTHT